jgi:hypothetical protein
MWRIGGITGGQLDRGNVNEDCHSKCIQFIGPQPDPGSRGLRRMHYWGTVSGLTSKYLDLRNYGGTALRKVAGGGIHAEGAADGEIGDIMIPLPPWEAASGVLVQIW